MLKAHLWMIVLATLLGWRTPLIGLILCVLVFGFLLRALASRIHFIG